MKVVKSPDFEPPRKGEQNAPHGSSRLNPFALPTDTTSRFVLLIVAVVSASLFAYNLLSLALPSTQDRLIRRDQCIATAATIPAPPNAREFEQQRIANQARNDCRRPVLLWEALIVASGLLSLLVVALILYLVIPTWKIRRRRLVPLAADDAPELVESFHDLSRQAGLPRTPMLLWNPLAPGGGALAFGRFNRSYVAVGAGLVVQHYADPQVATAVLRHELAHLVNRDVSKTYIAMALWYAFIIAGLLPLFVMEVVEGGFLSIETLWRLAALFVLIYGARNAVLRAREYYADAHAVHCAGRGPGLGLIDRRGPLAQVQAQGRRQRDRGRPGQGASSRPRTGRTTP